MNQEINKNRIIAQNRKAWYNYHIEEKLEAGLVLKGSEVKSLREGKCSMNEAYAVEMYDDLYMINVTISHYKGANQFNHEERRPRKLLLRKKQLNQLSGKIKIKGYTLVVLSLYFNKKNIVKAEIGLAKGKKEYDKRDTEKKRDWDKQQRSLLKNNLI